MARIPLTSVLPLLVFLLADVPRKLLNPDSIFTFPILFVLDAILSTIYKIHGPQSIEPTNRKLIAGPDAADIAVSALGDTECLKDTPLEIFLGLEDNNNDNNNNDNNNSTPSTHPFTNTIANNSNSSSPTLSPLSFTSSSPFSTTISKNFITDEPESMDCRAPWDDTPVANTVEGCQDNLCPLPDFSSFSPTPTHSRSTPVSLGNRRRQRQLPPLEPLELDFFGPLSPPSLSPSMSVCSSISSASIDSVIPILARRRPSRVEHVVRLIEKGELKASASTPTTSTTSGVRPRGQSVSSLDSSTRPKPIRNRTFGFKPIKGVWEKRIQDTASIK
ncbi:hypothetical protein J3Q64DRAFT_1769162 [Phycomyces blakesleeanus]|uniref:Uncharacterized protein n=2 Tax=Phycomyces blakesleeanus TaxID=4837 RepID=A0A162NK64_PHYB8|nr:hypothetical protein PHYBLDRAFT_171187 [Phycomyces blakesleeanus NRRL 1555(-)]OAD70434.1 hypothetical protein PHYBLDRAFT_171187 [Phycomyces blakesleeanus NRRL 1555(-)]|eukprot:XP_018288474.1 hypothetical protein PHYBLDRAFT_171187 [Phycomyces blakesleeanus NRRL 1555(-)]